MMHPEIQLFYTYFILHERKILSKRVEEKIVNLSNLYLKLQFFIIWQSRKVALKLSLIDFGKFSRIPVGFVVFVN